ncbi:MAG: hypothetical protein KAX19_06150, partial [Candidatus Brocadiae bacterium]|nr:hypothetical protein [Candidatus Brocadiia bacterium]
MGRGLIIAAVALALAGTCRPAWGQDALPRDQSRIHERMAEVEQRLLEMARLLEPERPERAEQLRQALVLSRERFIVSNMESIRALLAGERYGEAARLQREVLDDLARLAAVLGAEESAAELVRVRDAEGRLEEMVRKQSAAASETGELADPAEYAAAADGQEALREEAQELDGELRGGPGSEHLRAAVASMTAAAQALRGGAGAEALVAQVEAGGSLEAALAAVRQAA